MSQLVKDDGDIAQSSEEIAQELQKLFCSVFVQEQDGELPEFEDRMQEPNYLDINGIRREVKVELCCLNVGRALDQMICLHIC